MKRYTERLLRFFRLNFVGLAVGLAFYCLALTPSLLPMPAVFEGFVAGIAFAIGYGIGVFVSWILRKLVRRELPGQIKRAAWFIVLFSIPLIFIAYGVWTATWQNEVRELIGVDSLQGQNVVAIVAIAFVIAALLIFCARLIAMAIRAVSRFVGRWLPARISAAVGVIVVAFLLIGFYNGVIVTAFVTLSNNVYRSTNGRTKPGVVQPQNAMRSGSPVSHVPWDTLGRQGRSFVAGGPSPQELAEFSGQSANEPIRIYVGVESADDIETRAALAIRELERTNAFEREVLAVMTATGTGWIEPQSADSLEYIWNGDTALATIQYSYLPSWISFLVDQQRATEAGRALFNAVYERWVQLPENDRPKLLAYGLSLGAYGAQAAFSGIEDLQNRTDGALFMGSPSFSQPWGYFTAGRDPGSPQWQPLYDQGRAVRFAATPEDLTRQTSSWESPRIVYLQHASDPVVWWNFDLILNEPDWLKEPRGPDVTPLMQWYPFVTFTQVTVNQFFAIDAPPGHGHNYDDSVASAWAAIASPPDWNAEKAAKLQHIIDEYQDKD